MEERENAYGQNQNSNHLSCPITRLLRKEK